MTCLMGSGQLILPRLRGGGIPGFEAGFSLAATVERAKEDQRERDHAAAAEAVPPERPISAPLEEAADRGPSPNVPPLALANVPTQPVDAGPWGAAALAGASECAPVAKKAGGSECASRASGALSTAASQTRGKGRGARNARPKPAASEVSSEGPRWMRDLYEREGVKGELVRRGLLVNDISRSLETQPGVCVMKMMDAPAVKATSPRAEHRVKRLNDQLAKVHGELLKTQSEGQLGFGQRAVTMEALARTNDDPSAGFSNEFLPKQQRLTCGKPTLCRPMGQPYKDLPSMQATDSCFTSGYRGQYWWKSLPESQVARSKQYCRPIDDKYRYRENMILLAGCLRDKVCSF